jgi:hypothetical protein
MKAARLLAWLVSLVALMVPPGMTAHAMAPAHQVASVECPDHAQPPPPCPDQGTAKHAAGDCCPVMAPMAALLPAVAGVDSLFVFQLPAPQRAPSRVGRTVTKDPPPPRV